jgi:hypothetical protein
VEQGGKSLMEERAKLDSSSSRYDVEGYDEWVSTEEKKNENIHSGILSLFF